MQSPILFLAIIFLLCLVFSSAKLSLKKNEKKSFCTNNCQKPVYLINRQTGLPLDIYYDPLINYGGVYSSVRFSSNYHSWCILNNNVIISNENNFVLTFMGQPRCGVLPGTCGWQAQIWTFAQGRFPSQQNWSIKKEVSTGFYSIKEGLTIANNLLDRTGWLVSSGTDEVTLKITDMNDVSGQWTLQDAPACA